jgi:hypothetical protein
MTDFIRYQCRDHAVTLMKRRPPVILAFIAVAVVCIFAWLRDQRAGLRYAEVEGFRWDEKTQRCISVVLRVDDPQLLAQVQPWRDAVRREARNKALQDLLPWLQHRPQCENALRQPMERLTLGYEDGHRETEQVNVYKTPFGDCWRKWYRSGADVVP